MTVLENKYNLEQVVFLKTDKDQLPRMITAITIRTTGLIYELSQGTYTSHHYEFEITTEENELFKVK